MRKEKSYSKKGPFIVPTYDGELNIRQATETGYIKRTRGGVFDATYPNSEYRRSRVQKNEYVCGTITANYGNLYLYESIEEIEYE